jgi:hypothetical protein
MDQIQEKLLRQYSGNILAYDSTDLQTHLQY